MRQIVTFDAYATLINFELASNNRPLRIAGIETT